MVERNLHCCIQNHTNRHMFLIMAFIRKCVHDRIREYDYMFCREQVTEIV